MVRLPYFYHSPPLRPGRKFWIGSSTLRQIGVKRPHHIPSPYCWTVRGEPGLIIRWSSVPRYLRRKLLRAGIFPSKRGRRGQERSGDIWDWEGTFVEDSSSETEDSARRFSSLVVHELPTRFPPERTPDQPASDGSCSGGGEACASRVISAPALAGSAASAGR